MSVALAPVFHRTIEIDGIEIFYREAGPPDGPVVLLPHGYPSSSFQYRGFMAALGDRWRLIAPDYPAFGNSAQPDPAEFTYSFDSYADILDELLNKLGVDRFAVYLFDYGTWIGLRLATRHPERVAGLIIQNGDAYEHTMGPKYEGLKEYWADPRPELRRRLEDAVTERGLREEVLGEVPEHVRERISPELWRLAWARMREPDNQAIMVELMGRIRESVSAFPEFQAYLREHRPPALIVWGPHDGYLPAEAGAAYLDDLPDAELHLVRDAGHWLIETHLGELVGLTRDFLGRVHR